MESYNIGGEMADMVTSIPAMLGYVPTAHIALIGLTPVQDGPASHEVGPVVTIDIDDDAATSSAKAVAALMSAKEQGSPVPDEWIAVVVDSRDDRRAEGIHVVTELLPLALRIGAAVHLADYTPGTTLYDVREGGPAVTIGDYRMNPLTAMAAARGDVIFSDQQSWRKAGGQRLRAESMRRQIEADQAEE
jgi:hypothetical protein